MCRDILNYMFLRISFYSYPKFYKFSLSMNKLFSILLLACLFSISIKAQNFSTHKVKKGETIEGIAGRYYVTVYDIYSLNPDAKTKLEPNTILIIPISKAKKPKVTVVKELETLKKHKVKKKETLFGIAKEYNVSVDEIKKYNTYLYANTLKKGDKIDIPVFKVTEIVEESVDTKMYTVKPKEGKWRIAYNYGITVAELEALNPDMGAVLKEGQQIKVPNIDEKEKKEIDEEYSYYKVLPKEGYYRLKLKLGLDQAQLEALNPDLKETGLKQGMILKIPYSKQFVSTEIRKNSASLIDSISDYKRKHIAIMLPFRLNRANTDSISGSIQSIKKDPYLNVSLDFYSGVLMAIDSLKRLGLSLKVDVYDTKNELSEVSSIINSNDFESVDAVIGPLTSDNFDRAASELMRYKTPVISPIGLDLRLYDNVFQSRPPNDLLKNKVLDYVKRDSVSHHIILVSDSKNASVADDLKREFNAARIVYSRKNKEGKDQNYVLVDDIRSVLKKGRNIVFLETQNEGFASNVTSILASLINRGNKDKNIEPTSIVLTTTNYNNAFEGDEISNEHLSKLQFLYASGSRVYNENDNSLFAKEYEKKYNVSPNNRAVKGFDLTMDVVLRLVSSENLYLSATKAPLTEYLENKFAYKKKLIGGYYNDAVYLLKHDNLTVVDVE